MKKKIIFGCLPVAISAVAAEQAPLNVLFIIADDLRPQLGCYGVDWIKTPNIDALAAEGVRFDRQYVQMAVCVPTRVALLTSLRSERTHQVYGPSVWQSVEDGRPLGRTFSAAGYQTVSLGKIWHVEGGSDGDEFDVLWKPKGGTYASAEAEAAKAAFQLAKREKKIPELFPPITECLDVPDNVYTDGMTADRAITELRRLKESGAPFMLAVGFLKPHLPFAAPKKYWDMYDAQAIPLAPQPDYPENMPQFAFNNNANFVGSYDYDAYAPLDGGFGARMNDETARHLIHGYSAATGFVDAQVGRVLDELRALGLDKNTIVVLWGDHGFHLGDLNMWSKQSNFERATRSPLIVRAPDSAAGAVCNELVEAVDIFPTLLDLCGIEPLKLFDGRSFSPLLKNPAQPWKEAVFHAFNRAPAAKGREPVIGFSIRTKNARYIEWREGWNPDGQLLEREFYRYTDAQPDEKINEADSKSQASEVARHAKLLHAHLKGVMQ